MLSGNRDESMNWSLWNSDLDVKKHKVNYKEVHNLIYKEVHNLKGTAVTHICNELWRFGLFFKTIFLFLFVFTHYYYIVFSQFSSVTQLCPTLCNSMNRSTSGLPVHHQLLEFTQTHVHWVGDAIQPFHPLSSPSPPALNLSQHRGLFQWVSSSHQVAKLLEFQLQHQSFQWTPRTDLL